LCTAARCDEVADQRERLRRTLAEDAVAGIREHLETRLPNGARDLADVLGGRDRIELTAEDECRSAIAPSSGPKSKRWISSLQK
jgi:hypothetical protein